MILGVTFQQGVFVCMTFQQAIIKYLTFRRSFLQGWICTDHDYSYSLLVGYVLRLVLEQAMILGLAL
jgi:hypothetical protein